MTQQARTLAQRSADVAELARAGPTGESRRNRPRCGARLRGVRLGRTCQAPRMSDPDRQGELLPRCRQHGGAAMVGFRRWFEKKASRDAAMKLMVAVEEETRPGKAPKKRERAALMKRVQPIDGPFCDESISPNARRISREELARLYPAAAAGDVIAVPAATVTRVGVRCDRAHVGKVIAQAELDAAEPDDDERDSGTTEVVEMRGKRT